MNTPHSIIKNLDYYDTRAFIRPELRGIDCDTTDDDIDALMASIRSSSRNIGQPVDYTYARDLIQSEVERQRSFEDGELGVDAGSAFLFG